MHTMQQGPTDSRATHAAVHKQMRKDGGDGGGRLAEPGRVMREGPSEAHDGGCTHCKIDGAHG